MRITLAVKIFAIPVDRQGGLQWASNGMRIGFDLEDLTIIPETIAPQVRELPPSALGPDGKVIPVTDSVLATTNAGHHARYCDAQLWTSIS